MFTVSISNFTGLFLAQSSIFLTNKRLQLHGGGTSIRSFIHIDDVCEGTQRAAERGETGEVFHFATPQNISIRTLVELIAERIGVDFEEHVEISGERLGKDSAYLLDCTLAKERLQWEPRITLKDGLQSTTHWVKDNIDELIASPQDYIHKP